jgi:hypothetical protein
MAYYIKLNDKGEFMSRKNMIGIRLRLRPEIEGQAN